MLPRGVAAGPETMKVKTLYLTSPAESCPVRPTLVGGEPEPRLGLESSELAVGAGGVDGAQCCGEALAPARVAVNGAIACRRNTV